MAQKNSERIAVKGSFGLVSVDTWANGEGDKPTALARKFNPNDEASVAEFDLDSAGNGVIVGMGQCPYSNPVANRKPTQIVGNPAWDGMKGVTGVVHLVAQLIGLIQCAAYPPGKVFRQMVAVRTEHDLLGREVSKLSANLGFVGGEKKDATAECKTLRGTRYVFVAEKASACIGFEDSKANALKMILVKHGEIYATRVRMTRLNHSDKGK